ncbi:MAG: prolyl oligopeptidase family serine peptidase [Streptomycetaceae bacterium]|nr:prolyl oligopeptidase family serine peptidase [Streptomycetaceae bacterium]
MTAYPRVEPSDDVRTLPDGSTASNTYSRLDEPGPTLDGLLSGAQAIEEAHADELTRRVARAVYGECEHVAETSLPVVAGDRVFFTEQAPGAKRASLKVREKNGQVRVLVDALATSVPYPAVRGWYPSPRTASGRQYVAYSETDGSGAEMAAKWVVRDVDSGAVVAEYPHAPFGFASWAPDGETFVATERFATQGAAAERHTHHLRVMEHRIGRPYDRSREIVTRPGGPAHASRHPVISLDGRWIVDRQSTGGNGASAGVYLHDRETGENFVVQEDDGVSDWWPRFDRDNALWLWTNKGNGRGQVLTIDPGDIAAGRKTVGQAAVAVPEDPHLVVRDGGYTVLEAPDQPTRVAVVRVDRGHMPHLSVTDPNVPDGRIVVETPGVVPVRDEAGRPLGKAGAIAGLAQNPEEPGNLLMTFGDAVSPTDTYAVDVRDAAARAFTGDGRTVAVVPANTTGHTPALHQRVRMPALEGVLYEVPDTAPGVGHLRIAHTHSTFVRPTFAMGYAAFFGVETIDFKRYGHLAPAALLMGFDLDMAIARGGAEHGRTWWEMGHGPTYHNSVVDRAAIERDLVERELATTARLARIGGSAAGLDIAELYWRYPDQVAASVSANPSAGLLDQDMWRHGRRISEYGDPHVPADLARLAERDPEQTMLRLPEERVGRLGPYLISATLSDDRVSPKATIKYVAAIHDRIRDVPGAGPVVLAGAKGGHGWSPSPRSVTILGFTTYAMGPEVLADLETEWERGIPLVRDAVAEYRAQEASRRQAKSHAATASRGMPGVRHRPTGPAELPMEALPDNRVDPGTPRRGTGQTPGIEQSYDRYPRR